MPVDNLNDRSDRPLNPLTEALRRTQPWLTFFSVLFFISTGLLTIAALFSIVMLFISGGAILPGYWNAIIPLIYSTFGVIYFLFGWKIRRVSVSIKLFLVDPKPEQLVGFLAKTHSMWQFFGMITLCLILLQLVLIGGALGIAYWVHS